MRRSFQTVMIDVHNLLFDFERYFPDIDVDVSLLSFLPNRDGSDNTRSCKNNIMLKGNKKYQAVLEEVKKFADEIDELVEKGGLNRTRGYLGIPSLWYLIYDFCQYLFPRKKQNSDKEREVIDKKIREFLCKAVHSIATGNEGMMKEYIEDIEERMTNEKNSDVLELYKIVLGMRLIDRVSKREDMKSKWLDTPKNETLSNFIIITSKRVNEFGQLKDKDGRKAAETKVDRLEIKDRVRTAFTRQVCKLDNKLQDIVLDGQDQIVNAVVDCIEKHGGSPEQIVSTLIEEIKLNRGQVIRENTINAGLIDTGIERFVKSENNAAGASQNLSQNVVCAENNDGRQQSQSDQVATNLDEVKIGSEALHYSSI